MDENTRKLVRKKYQMISLRDEIKAKVFELLQIEDEEKQENVVRYIEDSITLQECCVLYAANDNCRKFLQNNGIDIGRKELIITNKYVKYSTDYLHFPKLVLSLPSEKKYHSPIHLGEYTMAERGKVKSPAFWF